MTMRLTKITVTLEDFKGGRCNTVIGIAANAPLIIFYKNRAFYRNVFNNTERLYMEITFNDMYRINSEMKGI